MRDYLQRAAIRAPNRIRVKKKTPPEGRVGKFMERATGLEPAVQAWEAWALPLGDARNSFAD